MHKTYVPNARIVHQTVQRCRT